MMITNGYTNDILYMSLPSTTIGTLCIMSTVHKLVNKKKLS